MPELDDFETLADDLRAAAPRPRDTYVAKLGQRVERGFPKQRTKRERRWFWGPGFALAACSIVVLVMAATVVISAGNGDDEEAASGGSAETASPMSSQDRALSPAPAPAPTTRRRVERRTGLELTPGRDTFDEVTAGVLRIADASGTIVQRSSVDERDGRGYATYDLRVPASEVDDVLADLSELAPVKARTATARDITAATVSSEARLDDARQERRALLRALARADSDREAGALRARLRDARVRISRAERDVRRLRARSDRARVDVTVASTGRNGDGGAWTPGDALRDAGRILEVAAGVVLVAGAVALPFALLLAAAAAAARLTRRRRREAALG